MTVTSTGPRLRTCPPPCGCRVWWSEQQLAAGRKEHDCRQGAYVGYIEHHPKVPIPSMPGIRWNQVVWT